MFVLEQQQKQKEEEQQKIKHALELEKLQKEQEFQLNCKRMELENSLRQCEITCQNSSTAVVQENTSNWMGNRFNLGLGKFNNQSMDLEAFLNRFELVATSYKLPKDLWPMELSKCLTGIALDTFDRLDNSSKFQYDLVVKALHKTFNISESTYRKLFKTSKSYPGERLSEFCNRLKSYLKSWLEKSIYTLDYDGLFNLMVSQAFFLSQEKPVQMFLKECGKLPLDEMIEKAQNYVDAHYEFNSGSQNSKNRNGHDHRNRDPSKQDSSGSKTETQTLAESQKQENVPHNSGNKQSEEKKTIICNYCKKPGHKAAVCHKKNDKGNAKSWDKSNTKAALCQFDITDNANDLFPTVALTSRSESEVYLSDLKYPFQGKAWVNGIEVNFLRDTGSCFNLVSKKLTKPEDFTGRKVSVRLADCCVRYLPEANIYVESPYFKGFTTALVLSQVVTDFVIGNQILKEKSTEEDFDEWAGSSCKQLTKSVIFENSARIETEYRPTKIMGNLDGKTDELTIREISSAVEPVTQSNMVIENSQLIENSTSLDSRDYVKMAQLAPKEAVKVIRGNCPGDEIFPVQGSESTVLKEIADENRELQAIFSGAMNLNANPQENHGIGLEVYNNNPSIVCDKSNSVVQNQFHTDQSQVMCVQTRAMAQKEKRKLKPLNHKVIDALDITRDEFIRLQKQDQSLAKYWNLVKSTQTTDVGQKVQFVVRDEVLYRLYNNRLGDTIEQLLVPDALRDKVVLFGHETTLSGHMGIGATYRKLCTNFYFPGMFQACKRLVASCLLCQQGANKSVGGKAPMGALPVISSEPFDTVYIDLVGKIIPASSEGHSYILTILDAATHYLLAVPMKKIDTESIAEVLTSQFDMFGYSRKIVSDNASCFTSDLMKQIYRKLGIQMSNIPVYFPQGNLVERQHMTLISILRKLTENHQKDWHRYLQPLLFAMRNTPGPSGFSPFELLFGRSGRTHLTFLKELWTGQNKEPETKVTYQYVLDLQNRIKETCDFAQKELAKVRLRNQRYFNKNAKLRKFKVNDKVWVINTKDVGKFDFNWIGPATVVEKLSHVRYRLQFPDGQVREYHINMIKAYIEREPASSQTTTQHDEANNQNIQNDLNLVGNENQNECAAMMSVIEIDEDENDAQECVHSIKLEENMCELPLPNTVQKETWRDVMVNPELPEKEQKLIWSLVKDYADIFSDVPTETNLLTYQLRVNSDEIVRLKPYKIPFSLVSKVDEELDKLLKMGWIEQTTSEYASPLVVVKKKNGELRICVSYKDINRISVLDPMPTKDMEDILVKLGKSKFISTFDCSKGFYAIPLSEDSKKYTGFVHQNSHYQFTRLCFGLAVAPSAYNRMMKELLRGATNMDNFVDDIICYDSSMKNHMDTLKDLFRRCRDANIKLRPTKVKLGFLQLEYLGMTVGNGQLQPTDESIQKILQANRPTTKKGVRSLVGMINWLRRFFPNVSQLIKPFNELLTKDKANTVVWTDVHQRAWEDIKSRLTSKPVLSLYDPEKEHAIFCDANQDTIAGVLKQLEDDGEYHPVIYISRKLSSAELRYDIQNKEMLSIVWTVSTLYRYLYNRFFTIFTDSCALSVLNNRLSNNSRVARWQLYLAQFQYRVHVLEGRHNCLADFLTREGT